MLQVDSKTEGKNEMEKKEDKKEKTKVAQEGLVEAEPIKVARDVLPSPVDP